MGSSIRHRLVTVEGEGHKYTNPGGFVRRNGEEYVLARRNDSVDDMATDDAKRSSIVLLKRIAPLKLSDDSLILLQGSDRFGYEDPRLLPCDIFKGERGFTYTFVVEGDKHCSWIKSLRKGSGPTYNKKMGPPLSPSKNGFLFNAEDGAVIVVSRPDGESIKFYRLQDVTKTVTAFSLDKELEWWQRRLFAEIELPSWARGKQGEFGHIGFGTVIGTRAAILHFGRSDDEGKYYVTALQRLQKDGSPLGPPEIIAEPAKNLPVGDVPNVIYTMMAWIEGRELVLWSGHDDTYIVETRMRSPL